MGVMVILLVFFTKTSDIPQVMAAPMPSLAECEMQQKAFVEAYKSNPDPAVASYTIGCVNVEMKVTG